ncbi:MAG: glycosyltransferase family 2 protein [Pseudomonadota bacterium]
MRLLRDIFRGKTGVQKRTVAALWRRRLRETPPSDTPLVVFAVPLVSKRRATDWSMVSANLARTLATFRTQTSGAWCAYVCGQDRPDGVRFDAHVQFLPYAGGDKFYDKGDKRLRIIDRAMADLAGRDGYYAQFDADDLLHPGVVAHIAGDNNGRGYIIEAGYVADLGAPRIAPLFGERPGEAPQPAFWHLCGSCVFARFDFRTQPRLWRRLLRRLKSHKRMAEVMAQHGLPLAALPFPAGIYLLNHGENMSRRRQRERGRLGYLDRHALPSEVTANVLAEFGQS